MLKAGFVRILGRKKYQNRWTKPRGGGLTELPPETRTGHKARQGVVPMIVFLCVSIKEIVERERDLSWQKASKAILIS